MAIIGFILILVIIIYTYQEKPPSFEDIYRRVDTALVSSLVQFRRENPKTHLNVNGMVWEYISVGAGAQTVLFLHGMAGDCNIWWRIVENPQEDWRMIAVTYPVVDTLKGLDAGISAILEKEGVDQVYIIGSSLGGYFAQYLAAIHPDRVKKVILGNTFSPNELIREKNGFLGMVMPFLPGWMVMSVMRRSFANQVYPAAGDDDLVLATLMEISYQMRKADVVARYRCVVDPFTAPDLEKNKIPVLIIEATNDPLVEPGLRALLKETYPRAQVVNLGNVGHFPYLNQAEQYRKIIGDFIKK